MPLNENNFYRTSNFSGEKKFNREKRARLFFLRFSAGNDKKYQETQVESLKILITRFKRSYSPPLFSTKTYRGDFLYYFKVSYRDNPAVIHYFLFLLLSVLNPCSFARTVPILNNKRDTPDNKNKSGYNL